MGLFGHHKCNVDANLHLVYFRRKYMKNREFYKARINAEIGRAELYTRMLDETKEEVKARESELRHIQEGWQIRGSRT